MTVNYVKHEKYFSNISFNIPAKYPERSCANNLLMKVVITFFQWKIETNACILKNNHNFHKKIYSDEHAAKRKLCVEHDVKIQM